MTDALKQIAIGQAEALLQPEQSLHVLIVNQDGPSRFDEARWPRSKVSEMLRKHGAYLSGPRAREANHGIFTKPDDKTAVFFETMHH